MDPASVLPIVPSLNNTFGALLLGTFFSSFLYGATCLQTYYYFHNYKDGILIKGTVALLWVLETVHSAFSIHAIYYFVILNYFKPGTLAVAVWTASATIGVTTVIILVVEVFYARRIYLVSRGNIVLTGIVAVLILAHLGFGLSITIRALQLKFFAEIVSIDKLVVTAVALAVAVDVLIAASLTYYLHTNRSGIRRTDALINRLIMTSINNGIITSIFDILVLIFITTESHNFVYLGITQVLSNLYTNSAIATLNSRRPTVDNHLGSTSVELSGGHHLSFFKASNSEPATVANSNPSEVDDGYKVSPAAAVRLAAVRSWTL